MNGDIEEQVQLVFPGDEGNVWMCQKFFIDNIILKNLETVCNSSSEGGWSLEIAGVKPSGKLETLNNINERAEGQLSSREALLWFLVL